MKLGTKLQKRQRDAVSRGVSTRTIYASRAENAELWDVEGRRFIDFAAGIAVNNTGHCHPGVMAAVAKQAESFTHTCFHVAPFEGYIHLAERLNAIVPISGPAKTMLATTGAEAVENAVKIARVATGRAGIISFSGAFHGRTSMGMALTGKVVPYKAGFGPFPGEIFQALFPNAFMGIDTEQAIASVRTLFSSVVAPDRIAAFIVEPVQGEGGFIPASQKFLAELRAIADQHGILLIVDEIQTGMARTGTMFALDRHEIKADIVTLAKGLAGGFPLSAVVGRADIMDAVPPGGLGGTYAGNPLAVAAALAVLDAIEQEDLCARAAAVGERISERLCDVARRPGYEFIGDVRGPGAMVAFEFVRDRYSRNAAPDLAQACVAEAEQRGLIVLLCGTRANVIRLLPPLTITDALLAEGLDILEEAITVVARRFAAEREEAADVAV